jgi:hypothetical protein
MRSKKPGRVAQRQAKLAKVRASCSAAAVRDPPQRSLTEALGAGAQEQDGPIVTAGCPTSTYPPCFLVTRARELAERKKYVSVKWLAHDEPSLPSRSTLEFSDHGRERTTQRDPSEASLNEALGVPAGARVAFEAAKEQGGPIRLVVVTAKAFCIFSGNKLITIVVDNDKPPHTDQRLELANKVQLANAIWHARCVAERLDDDSDIEW